MSKVKEKDKKEERIQDSITISKEVLTGQVQVCRAAGSELEKYFNMLSDQLEKLNLRIENLGDRKWILEQIEKATIKRDALEVMMISAGGVQGLCEKQLNQQLEIFAEIERNKA